MKEINGTIKEIRTLLHCLAGDENPVVRIAAKRIKPFIPTVEQIARDADLGSQLHAHGVCLYNAVSGNWIDGSTLALLTTVASHARDDAIMSGTLPHQCEMSVVAERMLFDLVISCREMQERLSHMVEAAG
jgi:hypothetical protein